MSEEVKQVIDQAHVAQQIKTEDGCTNVFAEEKAKQLNNDKPAEAPKAE